MHDPRRGSRRGGNVGQVEGGAAGSGEHPVVHGGGGRPGAGPAGRRGAVAVCVGGQGGGCSHSPTLPACYDIIPFLSCRGAHGRAVRCCRPGGGASPRRFSGSRPECDRRRDSASAGGSGRRGWRQPGGEIVAGGAFGTDFGGSLLAASAPAGGAPPAGWRGRRMGGVRRRPGRLLGVSAAQSRAERRAPDVSARETVWPAAICVACLMRPSRRCSNGSVPNTGSHRPCLGAAACLSLPLR